MILLNTRYKVIGINKYNWPRFDIYKRVDYDAYSNIYSITLFGICLWYENILH
jgi:hypothetical protein